MQNFIIKSLVTNNIEAELEKIGFDIAYRKKAAEKFSYKTFKIFDLTLPQANILKQTALSLGADCAVHRDILTANVEKTDVILGGSLSQLRKISEKLKLQPFSLPRLADLIEKNISTIDTKKTKLVGILNLTPDSFSDGGMFLDTKSAVKQLYKLVGDGADMIDIGAESTRPGFVEVDSDEQIRRLSTVIKEVRNLPVPVSVDTRNSSVARFALENGVKYINDVSGLEYDSKLVDVVTEFGAGIIIQHAKNNAEYDDLISEIYLTLKNKSEYAKEKGINEVIVDPGIGFGKTREQNFEILNRIEEFKSLNLPLYVGVSRKSALPSYNV